MQYLFIYIIITVYVAEIKAFVKDNACGITKGCFGDCTGSGSSCTYLIAWQSSDSSVKFTIQAEGSFVSDSYVSFGLSPTQKMDDASVTACRITHGGSAATYENSYNYGHHNRPVANPTDGLSSFTYKYQSSMFTCTFTRANINPDSEVFNLQNDYYMMFAKGPIRDGRLHKHHGHSISARKVDLQSTEQATEGSPDRIKAHGTIAIIAWMTFMNLGAIIARHFRPLLSERQLLGSDIWFLIHRIAMVLGSLLTIVAFSLVIHKSLKIGTTSSENSHPVLGITLLCIAVINPILGVFRPDKESKFRPIFYTVHCILALAASFMGPINIFLGIRLKQAAVSPTAFYVLISHEVIKITMIIMLEVILFMEKRSINAEQVQSISTNQSDNETPSMDITQREKQTYMCRCRKILLAIYIIKAITFTVVMVILVETSTSFE